MATLPSCLELDECLALFSDHWINAVWWARKRVDEFHYSWAVVIRLRKVRPRTTFLCNWFLGHFSTWASSRLTLQIMSNWFPEPCSFCNTVQYTERTSCSGCAYWPRLHALPFFSLSNWETGASEIPFSARLCLSLAPVSQLLWTWKERDCVQSNTGLAQPTDCSWTWIHISFHQSHSLCTFRKLIWSVLSFSQNWPCPSARRTSTPSLMLVRSWASKG